MALPLPLQVVKSNISATSATTGATGVSGTGDKGHATSINEEASNNNLRGSGDWQDFRGSFNRSFDADKDGAGSKDKKSSATGAAGEQAGLSLSQRLLTDAKLFRPLASQWANGKYS